MKAERELLELAAKAIGEVFDGWALKSRNYRPWHPLTDYFDAFELAARLKLRLEFNSESCIASYVDDGHSNRDFFEYPDTEDERTLKMCQAIVRAAVEIGAAV